MHGVSLATVYEEKSNFDLAISCLKKAIELDPDNVDYFEYIARIYHITDQIDNAIIFYNKAIKMLPEKHRFLDRLGRTLFYGNARPRHGNARA